MPRKKIMPPATCRGCGVALPLVRSGMRQYCGNRCRDAKHAARLRALNPPDGPRRTSGTSGAISELLVAADMLRRGYDVFRAMSPSCSCDLVVLLNGALTRVEVRTGAVNADGSIRWQTSPRDIGRSDVYGVVVRTVDGLRIQYFPDLPASQ